VLNLHNYGSAQYVETTALAMQETVDRREQCCNQTSEWTIIDWFSGGSSNATPSGVWLYWWVYRTSQAEGISKKVFCVLYEK